MHIHYLRPPDRIKVFDQKLLLSRPDVRVTLAEALEFSPPLVIDGEIALETGSDAVWFTFPGSWHDIGLFHRADGTFVGLYANILTPPEIRGDGTWHTTDLFLDVWVNRAGELRILDEEELEEAEQEGWVSPEDAARARAEAARITAAFREGTWPPEIVGEWDLPRAKNEAESWNLKRF